MKNLKAPITLRKNVAWLALFSIAMPCNLYGQAPPAPPQQPSPAASLTIQRLVAAEEKSRFPNAGAYYDALAPLQPPGYSPTAVSTAIAGLSRRLEQHETNLTLLKANNRLVDLALKAGTRYAAATGVQGLVLAAVGEGLRQQLGYVEKVFDENGIRNAQKVLGHELALYRDKYNDPTFKSLEGKTADEVFDSVFGPDHPLRVIDLAKVDPRGQAVVTGFMFKAIQDTLLTNKLQDLQIEQRQDAEMATLRRDLTAVGQVMSAYFDETDKQLASLAEQQEEIRQGLEALDQRVGKTEQDVAFLQEFTFGQMPPAQQLAALKNGFFATMDPTERANLERRVELAEKRVRLTQTLAGYLDGAATVVKIASDLKIQSPFVAQVAKGVEIGSAAFSAFTALASQNYLGAVSAITGLMGGGGRDIAGERHSQLVGMLEDVLKGQQQILDGIYELRQGQIQIMQNQQRILDAVVTVSQQIAENHEEVMRNLLELRHNVFTILSLTKAELRSPVEACKYLLEHRAAYRYTGGTPLEHLGFAVGGSWGSYKDMTSHFKNYDGDFKTCLAGLVKFDLNDQGRHNPLFRHQTYDDNPGAFDFREKRFRPLVELWPALHAGTAPTGKDLALLMYPTGTLDDLDDKLALKDPGSAVLRVAPAHALEEFLNVGAVEEHASLLHELHFYFEVLDDVPTGRPVNLAEFLADSNPRRRGRDLLEDAVSVINAAIAQQTLLAGDILLPKLYEAFKAGKAPGLDAAAPERKLGDKVLESLAAFPLLRRNFLRYSLRRELKEANISLFEYAIALEMPSPMRLRGLLPAHWELVPSDPATAAVERSILVGSQREALPTASELLTGTLDQTPELQRLLSLRAALVNQIAGYDMAKSFGAKQGAFLLWLARQNV